MKLLTVLYVPVNPSRCLVLVCGPLSCADVCVCVQAKECTLQQSSVTMQSDIPPCKHILKRLIKAPPE